MKKKINRLCRVGMEVQTVLFDGAKWTRKDARAWLLEHRLKAPKAMLDGTHLRYRTAPTTRFKKDSFRTKQIPRKGIKLVIACPKQTKKTTAKRKVNERITVPGVLVDIGQAVEIALDGETMVFRGFVLASNVQGNRLYLLKKNGQRSARAGNSAAINKARDLYSKFTDFEAENDYKLKAGTGDFKKIGTADHIVYKSDKWTGKPTEYIHEFVTPPSIYANRSKTILVLIGKINVKQEGITG